MKIFLLIVLVWTTAAACTVSKDKESNSIPEQKEFSVSADWKRIDGLSVEFYIPPDFEEKKLRQMLQPRDGKFYGNENVWLTFGVLSFSKGNQEYLNQSDFRLEKIIVDGKQGEISTFTGTDMQNEAKDKNYVAILDVPQIQGNTKNLIMWAYSKTPEDRETVIKIFKSVRFLKE